MAAFIIRYGTVLYAPFGLIGIIAFELINTPRPAAFKWACLYLGIPVVAGTAIFVWRCHDELLARMRGGPALRRLQVYLTAILFCPVTLLFCGGYAVLANALIGPHSSMIYQGIVIAKSTPNPHTDVCTVTVENREKHQRMRFRLSEPEDKIIGIGAPYSRGLKTGCLGIPYCYRWES